MSDDEVAWYRQYEVLRRPETYEAFKMWARNGPSPLSVFLRSKDVLFGSPLLRPGGGGGGWELLKDSDEVMEAMRAVQSLMARVWGRPFDGRSAVWALQGLVRVREAADAAAFGVVLAPVEDFVPPGLLGEVLPLPSLEPPLALPGGLSLVVHGRSPSLSVMRVYSGSPRTSFDSYGLVLEDGLWSVLKSAPRFVDPSPCGADPVPALLSHVGRPDPSLEGALYSALGVASPA